MQRSIPRCLVGQGVPLCAIKDVVDTQGDIPATATILTLTYASKKSCTKVEAYAWEGCVSIVGRYCPTFGKWTRVLQTVVGGSMRNRTLMKLLLACGVNEYASDGDVDIYSATDTRVDTLHSRIDLIH